MKIVFSVCFVFGVAKGAPDPASVPAPYPAAQAQAPAPAPADELDEFLEGVEDAEPSAASVPGPDFGLGALAQEDLEVFGLPPAESEVEVMHVEYPHIEPNNKEINEHEFDFPQAQAPAPAPAPAPALTSAYISLTDPTVLQQQRDAYEARVAKQLNVIVEQFEKLEEKVRAQHQRRLESSSLLQQETGDLLQLEVDEEFRSEELALRERFNEMKVHISDEGKRLKDAQFKFMREYSKVQFDGVDMAYNEQITQADKAFEKDIGEFARVGRVLLEQRKVGSEDRRHWFSQQHVPPQTMQPMHDPFDKSMNDFPRSSMHGVLQNLKRNMAEL